MSGQPHSLHTASHLLAAALVHTTHPELTLPQPISWVGFAGPLGARLWRNALLL